MAGLLLAVLVVLCTLTSGKPVKAPTVKTNTDALKFLDKFGYSECSGNKDDGPLCQSSLRTMIEHFQAAFHLEVTGKLDGPTIKLMNTPRCSLGDYPLAYSAFRAW